MHKAYFIDIPKNTKNPHVSQSAPLTMIQIKEKKKTKISKNNNATIKLWDLPYTIEKFFIIKIIEK